MDRSCPLFVAAAIAMLAAGSLGAHVANAQGSGTGPGWVGGGCRGMNCPGGPGQGMMGRGPGYMPRHRQLMMGNVPEPYNSMTNPLLASETVIQGGRSIYLENCSSCHGSSGQGDGEAGHGLSPVPSDLAALMQMPPMHQDSYLMWTISEGGVPFGTAMPAFKDILTQDEIWSVIRYLQAGLPQTLSTPR